MSSLGEHSHAYAALEGSQHAGLALAWVTPPVQAPRVTYRTFDSVTVGTKVSYHAYVPAAHDRSTERLPVLYWLHGTEGGPTGVRPLSRRFDEAIEAGRLPPMIVVFVNGLPRRLWADSKDGASPVETVFIREVIPHVDRRFRTLVRHAVGTLDDTRELNRQFRERMAELGIAHTSVELPGIGHEPHALFEALGEANGRFYRQALGLAAPEPRP